MIERKEVISWRAIAVIAFVPVIILLGIAIYLLNLGGYLPWQTDPTPIARTITPFAGITNPFAQPSVTTAPFTTPSVATLATAIASPLAVATPATPPATPLSRGELATPFASPVGSPVASPVASPAPESSSATPATPRVSTPVPGGPARYTIVSDQSSAQYSVNETIGGVSAPDDAVGKTNAVRGQIVIGSDGKPTSESVIQVDLRTLTSDQSRRDNYIQENTLANAPLAEFKVTGVDDWPGPLVDGETATFQLNGDMTINGVTKHMTFAVTATVTGNTLTGTAKSSFVWKDFNLVAPNTTFVSVKDNVNISLTITAMAA